MADDADRTERLASRTVGEAGPHVVFVHGLFGQGKNWTTIAKGLADRHRVTLLDLPNHGHSPWTDRVDYLDMAELLAAELRELGEPVTLVGHSMGGKVAMQLALRHPELLRALVVVDVAPSDYPESGARTDDPDEEATPFAGYIAAMRATGPGQPADQGRRRRGPAHRRPQPDGALVPAAEPGAGRGRTAGGGGSTSRRWPATSGTCAASPRRPRAPRSTVRCSGSPGRTRPTCCRRTGPAWTSSSRRPAS